MREARLAGLVGGVLDGEPLDWSALEAETDPADRDVLRGLQALDRIVRGFQGTAPAGAETEGEPPGHLGQWGALVLLARIGGGAYGEVWSAWDPTLAREVALKLLHPDDPSRPRRAAAIEEARRLARVHHPNVVVVYGAEEREGRVGLWMERIRGENLASVVQDRGPLSAREAALIGVELCHALAAIHREGLVHRDVKAQNVVRGEGGRIVLMDLGAGVDLRHAAQAPMSGTPLYLAPEVLTGAAAGPGSDLYALGVLLYYLVSGGFPVEGKTLGELRAAHASGHRRRLRDARPDLPEGFVRVVERALAPLTRRYPTAGALAAALGESLGLEGAAPAGTKRGALGRWAMAAGLAAAALFALWRLVAPAGQAPIPAPPVSLDTHNGSPQAAEPPPPSLETVPSPPVTGPPASEVPASLPSVEPAATPPPLPSREPSPVEDELDRRRRETQASVERTIATLAPQARRAESLRRLHDDTCRGQYIGVPVANASGPPMTLRVPKESTSECQGYQAEASRLEGEVRTGLAAVEDEARRGWLLPGTVRELRQRHGLGPGPWDR